MASNNYITDFLLRQGLKADYDMTGKQLDARDKESPLGAFGYQTGQDKQEALLRNQILQQERQRQDEQLKMQYLMHLNPQQKTGYFAGQGLQGIVNNLFGKKQQAPQQAQDTSDDPAVTRYKQLTAQLGDPNKALLQLGTEMNNPSMISAAQKNLMAADKADLENQKLRKEVSKKDIHYMTGPAPDVGGVPQEAIYQYNPDEGTISPTKYSGTKGSATGPKNTFGERPTTISQAMDKFQNRMSAANDTLDVMDAIKQAAAQGGQGWGAKLAGIANNAKFGVQDVINTFSDNVDPKLKAELAKSIPFEDTLSGIRGKAQANAQMDSLMIRLAYTMAASENGVSQKVTDADVKNKLKVLGSHLNDPQAFSKVLDSNRQLLIHSIDNASEYQLDQDPTTGAPIKMKDKFAQMLQSLHSRAGGSSNNTGMVRIKDPKGNIRFIPENLKDQALAAGGTLAE